MKQLLQRTLVMVFITAMFMSTTLMATTATQPPLQDTESAYNATTNPYVVSTLGHLSWLAQNTSGWDKAYKQITNIDAVETQYWDDVGSGDLYDDADDATSTGNNEGFSPIGSGASNFTGSYDGQGHTISNLAINRNQNFVGFFGFISGATIKNLGVVDINIDATGANGAMYSASLVGSSYGNSTVENCYGSGAVSGKDQVGGIQGAINHSSIFNCYSRCSVSGTNSAGGFICDAIAYDGETINITNCYSTGSVSGAGAKAGLVLHATENGTGSVNVVNCFWDKSLSIATSDAGTGKTTAEMKAVATFTNQTTTGLTIAWDFETNPNDDSANNDYWDIDGSSSPINSGYPFLSWQNGDDTSLPVELSSWKVSSTSGLVNMTWTTDSEIENLGFIIERINATGKWESIASFNTCESLRGQGSTTKTTAYHLTDKNVQIGRKYTYRLSDVDYHSRKTTHAEISVVVKAEAVTLIDKFTLTSAFPNPFNPTTTIRYHLTDAANISLMIYDAKGQMVKIIKSGMTQTGSYSYTWNGTNASGQAVSAGVYLVRMQFRTGAKTIKMVYLK